MTDRAFQIHFARVMLAEASRRRHQRFYWTLIEWAQKARRDAMAMPRQPELFA
ncbi:MAG: hypothetical protein KGL35_28075 [Bradyrhizobium sp.]|nr:hypothetical protein [Bradyrhizobium sp.]